MAGLIVAVRRFAWTPSEKGDRQVALAAREATKVLGEKRLSELSAKDVYAWRLTIPEGHRFEAT
jgi:hypothetical protein